MWCDYEEVKKKLYPGVEFAESVKEVLELTSLLGEKIDPAGIIRHCTAKLAYFKVPRFIEMVESFPKTATERIQKMELKEREKKKSDHGWDRDKEMPDWKQR